ncbi:OHP1 [Scenedesmus sp. PABB004]|nr:OHP1 [Scenedesmus sp. PABB004]
MAALATAPARAALQASTSGRPAVARPALASRQRVVVPRAAKLPAGVSAPPRTPTTPLARFGFVQWAEKINSRAAMLGFFGILLVEALAGKGVFELAGFTVGQGLGFDAPRRRLGAAGGPLPLPPVPPPPVPPPPMARPAACTVGLLLLALAQPAAALPIKGGAAREAVFTPRGNVSARVWTNASAPGFVWPELSDTEFGMPALLRRPNLGIALSGGGMRATTLALGWVRALWQMGVLQRARYLASNSGGSWFNGAFSFTQAPLRQFLGPYVPPQNLTLAVAGALPWGSYAAAISDAQPVLDIVGSTVVDAVSAREDVRAWSDAIGEAFLEPFGVGDHASSVTTLGTRGRVHERVAAEVPVPLLTAGTQERPFPILLGSLILRNDSRVFFPFEFTPLYFGSPPLAADARPVAVGGGMVEPLGFNSAPPGAGVVSPDGSKSVSVASDYVVSLAQAVGVSSSFVAQKTRGGREGREELLSVEELDYWNQYDFRGTEDAHFADGGGHDNTAITPLLRRGVTAIIAGCATSCATSTNATDYAACQWDISGLFGAIPLAMGPIDGVEPAVYNKMLQVFPTSAYAQFYAALRARTAAGGAAVVRQALPVLPNAHLGVAGGFTTTLLWLLNAPTPSWEAALPDETRELLARHRGGKALAAKVDRINPLAASSLKDFPLISTFAMDYTPQLTQLLSQLASWTATQAGADMRAMAAGGGGAPAAGGGGAPAAAGGAAAGAPAQQAGSGAPAAAGGAGPAGAAAAKPAAAAPVAGAPGAALNASRA